MIGAFRSVYRSKVSTCIVDYVGQYCESKSVCCLSVDVVDESFVGCGKTYHHLTKTTDPTSKTRPT